MGSFSILWQANAWLRLMVGLGLSATLWHIGKNLDKKTLMFWRALAALCLFLAVLRPLIVIRKSALEKPKVLVLIDRGNEMGGPAGPGSRLKSIQKWFAQNANEIESRADISVFALSTRAQKITSTKNISKLKIAESDFLPEAAFSDLQDQAENFQAQRAWFFSDGNASKEDISATLPSLHIPVDVISIGSNLTKKGLLFKDIQSPDFAFLHGKLSFSVEIEAQKLAGHPISLTLLKKSDQNFSRWEIISQKKLTPNSDFDLLSSSLTVIADRLGSEVFRLKAEAPGVSKDIRDITVPVIRQKYRILFLAGRPSFEYSFLRRFIKSDPRRELVSFVILRNPQNPVFIPDNELSLIPFPAQNIFLRDISQFDLFILEDFSMRAFNLPPAYLESIKRYVAGGGSLLVLGGPHAFSEGGYKGSPLEEILPVSLSAHIPDFISSFFNPVPVSLKHPLIDLYSDPADSQKAWGSLPPLKGYGVFSALNSESSSILIDPSVKMPSGQPLPIVAVRKFGRGRVMLIGSNSLWRWKLGLAQGPNYSDFYDRFWSRAIEYLTGTLTLSRVKFSSLPDKIKAVEPARFFLSVFDQGFSPMPPEQVSVSSQWTDPSGKTRPVLARLITTGHYEMDITGIHEGINTLQASAYKKGRLWGRDSVRFDWRLGGAHAPIQTDALKRAAKAAGGEFFNLEKTSVKDLLRRLPPRVKKYQVSRRYDPCAEPLWLWLCAGLFIIEWILRRKRGLP